MPGVLKGQIGIRPPGALGVACFYHLTRGLRDCAGVRFLLRRGGESARALTAAGQIDVQGPEDAEPIHLDLRDLLLPDLPACWQHGTLPEIVLACPNPDQLLGILDEMVAVTERAHAEDLLKVPAPPLPMVVLCSNGIYFQRLRQLFVERLEESTLMGRLPDLWPSLMPRIVSRLLRGITLQTGVRVERNGRPFYRPGPMGPTYLAGGDSLTRHHCASILRARGGVFEVSPHGSATRLEFDKAMINLVSNLLGQILAVGPDGRFRRMTVGEIHQAAGEPMIRELVQHVLEVGRAVRVYPPGEAAETHMARLRASAERHGNHVPSSLQWLDLKLRHDGDAAGLTPTEAWLLDPLIRYARSAGLEDSASYFEGLRRRLMQKLEQASRARESSPS